MFAVICAGLFPVIHMGRPWLFYWMVPYPNWRGPLWVNFRSPLVWDFFAIGTYFTISLVFWYVGLIPDLATLRDRVRPGWYRRFVGFLSLGWNGSYRTWHRYEVVYLLLAGLATPLVVSVHSVVSTDFAAALLPGWHSTIFPPYFVAGAIFSGMAMVLTLMLLVRKAMHLEDYITPRHVDAMTKLVLATSCLVGLAYAIEFFTALYCRQSVRVVRVPQPGPGTAGLGLCDHGRLQRAHSAVFLVSPGPPQFLSGLCHLRPGQRRHVDGAVHHHCRRRWSAIFCRRPGAVTRPPDRAGHAARQLRPVLHLFFDLLPVLAGDRHGGGQGGLARDARVQRRSPVQKGSATMSRRQILAQLCAGGRAARGSAGGPAARLADCRGLCSLCRARPGAGAGLAALPAAGGVLSVRATGVVWPCGSSFGPRRGTGRSTSAAGPGTLCRLSSRWPLKAWSCWQGSVWCLRGWSAAGFIPGGMATAAARPDGRSFCLALREPGAPRRPRRSVQLLQDCMPLSMEERSEEEQP